MDKNLNLAVAQVSSIDGDIENNISKAISIIKHFSKRADIIVFPEKFITGYIPEKISYNKQKYCLSEKDSRLIPLTNICKQTKTNIIIGSPLLKNNEIYNSVFIINNQGKIKGTYDKMFLFDSEKNIYHRGEKFKILNYKGWRIGIGICYDAGFPEHSRILAELGCDVYVVSGLFSTGTGYRELSTWFPARALDNGMFSALSNYYGQTGEWDSCGFSGIWSPWGEKINSSKFNGETVICEELNYGLISDAKKIEKMVTDIQQYYEINSINSTFINLEE